MDNISRKLMIGACEIACRCPSLSLEDAVGDARQLAGMLRQYCIGDPQKEESVLTAACWFIGAEPDISPKEAIDKALHLWNIITM
jgi:hypothetical protein